MAEEGLSKESEPKMIYRHLVVVVVRIMYKILSNSIKYKL